MMSVMTNTAPAGWYADPSNPTVEHWWDGTAYNGTRATTPVAAPPAAPSTPQAVQPGAVYVTVSPGSVPAYGRTISPKSRTVASILGFFFGGLGVDRFYLGNIGMGVAKLLLGWLTLGVWPLIDWIVILAGSAHDGEGLPVTNWN
jgi:TM2 domain/Protein of unknown function (DUF2510)